MKKTVSIFMLIGLAVLVLGSSPVIPLTDETFKPVEMPNKLANGDAFPTDSTKIESWISKSYALNGLETQPDIISHSWGLWQALTSMTNQTFEGRKLRLYETWYTPQDVMRAMNAGSRLPTELGHTGGFQARPKFEAFEDSFHGAELDPEAGDIVGKVKYDPTYARYALQHNLFDEAKMQQRTVPGGIGVINLPPGSVSLKPIYRVLTDKAIIYEGMYRFHVWSGKSDGGKEDSDFAEYIYVCTDPGDRRIDNVQVFGISDFIHHKMSAGEAQTYNGTKSKEGAEYNNNKAKEGDIVITLGMHVSTRETVRWTWQSFYWSPNPDNPVFPSSATMAAGRGKVKGLSSPANHYAVSLGYSMLSPAAPHNLDYTKGIRTDNRGSVYALNPYIEGTFTADVFANQQEIFQQHGLGSLFKARNIDGITSSCMGCHSMAAHYTEVGVAAGTFVADQYVPRNAPWFIGKVQTDFAWSLSGVFEQKVDKED